jgi:hypothetical protein
MKIHLEVLVPSLSTPNTREHFFIKTARIKKQRAAVRAALDAQPVTPAQLGDPMATGRQIIVVRLTRLSRTTMDDDNLGGTFKAVRDEIAGWLAGLPENHAHVPDSFAAGVRFFPYQGKGAAVKVAPVGRQKKPRVFSPVLVEIRTEQIFPPLGVSLDELKHRAELALLTLEAAEAEAKEWKSQPELAEWLGVGTAP